MSNDKDGVIADSPTAGTGGDQGEAQNQSTVSEDVKPQDGKDDSGNKIPESVKYDRFKEKVDEANSLKARIAELEASQAQASTDTDKGSDNELSSEGNNLVSTLEEKIAEKVFDKVIQVAKEQENKQVELSQAQQQKVDEFKQNFNNDEELQGFISYAQDIVNRFGNTVSVEKLYEDWDKTGRPGNKPASVQNNSASKGTARTDRNASFLEIARESARERGVID